MHPADNHYQSQTVRLADLTVITDTIQGQTFDNCTILGPAIVLLLKSNLSGCHFVGDLEAMLYPVDRTYFIGVIGLIECNFYGCRFERIGFAGPAEHLDSMRSAVVNP
jgi:hypothetical protein